MPLILAALAMVTFAVIPLVGWLAVRAMDTHLLLAPVVVVCFVGAWFAAIRWAMRHAGYRPPPPDDEPDDRHWYP